MEKAIKNLTQIQKNYFIKRVDEVTAQKMSKVRKVQVTTGDVRQGYARHYYTPGQATVSETTLDKIALAGIVSGKIKLFPKKDVIAGLKEVLESDNSTSSYSSSTITSHFVDKDSLAVFNKARNAEAATAKEKQESRLEAIRKIAGELKDKIMLEGNLATELLERFEKTEF